MTVPYLKSSLLEKIPFISHGFFSSEGGVSQGLFASLNAGYEKGDLEENVTTNRRRIYNLFPMKHLSSSMRPIITLKQKGTNQVHLIDIFPTTLLEGDAIISSTKGLLLGILTADCAPILICDPIKQVIAAVHAGWPGAFKGIIENTVEKMKKMGCSVKDLQCAIGPCIWQESYEVQQEFYDRFNAPSFFKKHNQSYYFDLPGYVYEKLTKLGIIHITPSPVNTYPEENHYFSYRRATHLHQKEFGNQISVIGLNLD